ncbi:MAG: DnaJ family domain-containing protein [Omnitrophica WOR_2 bacterium]
MSKADEQIQRAMEEGKFENLPGKGKPLKWDENPFEDPEWRLANKILHDNGFTLPWIQARQEIEAEIQAVREAMLRAWEWQKSVPAGSYPREEVDAAWRKAEAKFREQIMAINRQIFNYNLQAPSLQVQLLQLNVERELEAIKK